MKYGFCTWFATLFKDGVDYELLEQVKQAGYDYAEFPLMVTARISNAEFDRLTAYMKELNLGADVSCNLFPKEVRVTGNDVDDTIISDYLDIAFERMRALATKKLVFGSSPARDLPAGFSKQKGYEQLNHLIQAHLIPRCEKDGVQLTIEAINTGAANFITHLEHGYKVAKKANHSKVSIMADTEHLLYNGEKDDQIEKYFFMLDHIHVCESGRGLPVSGYSHELKYILEKLAILGYDKSISFESMPVKDNVDIRTALLTLKAKFE